MAGFVAFGDVTAEVPGDRGRGVGAGPSRSWLSSFKEGLEEVGGVSTRVLGPVAPLVAEVVPVSLALVGPAAPGGLSP